MFITETNVLAVGIGGKSDVLQELPVRLLLMDKVADAISCLRREEIHTVISRWELIDMTAGEFLKKIREARPAMPTIAFVKPGDEQQEISARALGVSVVLPENIDDDHFRESVCQVLKLRYVANIKTTHDFSGDIGYLDKSDELSDSTIISSSSVS